MNCTSPAWRCASLRCRASCLRESCSGQTQAPFPLSRRPGAVLSAQTAAIGVPCLTVGVRSARCGERDGMWGLDGRQVLCEHGAVEDHRRARAAPHLRRRKACDRPGTKQGPVATRSGKHAVNLELNQDAAGGARGRKQGKSWLGISAARVGKREKRAGSQFCCS